MRAGDAARAGELAKAFVADRANRYQSVETSLNTLGYQLLEADRLADAIAVFRINAGLYPADPANANAAEMVRRLEGR